MNKKDIILGYEIKTVSSPILKPTELYFWNPKQKNIEPNAPFTYMGDALVGLASIRLNSFFKTPFNAQKFDFDFCYEAWRALEPSYEIYQKTHPRIEAIRSYNKAPTPPAWKIFEGQVKEVVEKCCTSTGINLENLFALLPHIEELESQSHSLLLYNFNLKFSQQTVCTLQALYSLLFNLRAVIALDHNAYTQDPTYEALKVDPITDYLPKAEYVVNDAMIYFQFQKMNQKYLSSHRDSQFEKTFSKPMEDVFDKYLHNGAHLINQLPKSFLNSFNTEDLENALYLTQMDWLLGSDSGLLFKIREELYALQEGYENIFWPDLTDHPDKKEHLLKLCCVINEQDIYHNSAA